MNKRGSPKPRLCLPVAQWPLEDQRRWLKASAQTSVFDDDGGELAGLSNATRKRYEMGWGRSLNYLHTLDPRLLDLKPSKRWPKENIQFYMDEMRRTGNSDGTILCRLEELAMVGSIFDPQFERRLIDRHVAVLKARATPVRSKSHIKTADELVNLGFWLMESASNLESIKHAAAYRDGIIIAFLALHPVRRRNLVNFHLDKNLIKQAEGFLVVFAGSETKTGVPYQVPLADVLIEPMKRYLTVWRPVLMHKVTKKSRLVGASVWVTSLGAPMSPNAVSGCIEKRTREAFGKSIHPHGFRDASATTLVVNDPAHVRAAAPLLGHRSLETTEKYYIQATGLEAQRSYLDVLEDYRKGGKR